MFQSLLTFIRKQNYLPQNTARGNIFFFTNSLSFFYKLTNWTMWYIYLVDTLRSVTLRVYSKNWNKVFMITFFSYTAILIFFMFF